MKTPMEQLNVQSKSPLHRRDRLDSVLLHITFAAPHYLSPVRSEWSATTLDIA
jgi:hypothetical protein